MPGSTIESRDKLAKVINELAVDGTELMVYRDVPNEIPYSQYTVGVHLNYWPMWMDLQANKAKVLNKFFPTTKSFKEYYNGASNYEEWINFIKNNIYAGLKEQPEYMVWHIAEATMEEVFTFEFTYSDLDIVKAAAAVFNQVSANIPSNVLILFENLWWPGLRLTDKIVVQEFFSRLNYKNVGIMLDTGHLLNTNPNITTQAEGIEYICNVLEKLGDAKRLIKGLHLNCSLSGQYIRSFERKYDRTCRGRKLYKHISNIDQHQPFTDPRVSKIIELLDPKYVVHELMYQDFNELMDKVYKQMTAIRGI